MAASPRSSAIAPNRYRYTVGYSSGRSPSEACLWATRESTSSGYESGCCTIHCANTAMDPASARGWVPSSCEERENMPSIRSGRAANMSR